VGITDIATAMKSSRNLPNPERLNHPDVFGTTRVIDRAMEKNCKKVHSESLCRAFVSHIPGSKHQIRLHHSNFATLFKHLLLLLTYAALKL
jgi:hypothetical protein